jgi:hypothetical protein
MNTNLYFLALSRVKKKGSRRCENFATGCLIKLLPYANRAIQFAQEFSCGDKSRSSFIDAN